jgi:hypothetical protein
MSSAWVSEELKTVRLDDRRLEQRLRLVLSQLAERPTASIAAACGGHSEMTAAYRLFGNEKASFGAILQAHVDATRERINAQRTVVLVQDTTELDLTRPERQVTGAGPLDGASRFGALLHVLYGFTPDGTPMGVVAAEAWTRSAGEARASSQSRAQRAAMPIEEKESYRWVRTLGAAEQLARGCPATQCISVADSEADVYELLAAAAESQVRWIVRACQNRALRPENGAPGERLWERALAAPPLFVQTVSVRGRRAKVSCERRTRRQPRQSRQAEVAVRAARVVLRPPWRADRNLPEATVNVVFVREQSPPPGDEPVEWLLLTNLPIDDVQQVRQVIEFYCVRWMIEVFFRVLKSGCRIQQRRLEQLNRTLACTAVYLIVAWRSLYACRLGRSRPKIDCEAVFDPAEWKAAWKIVHRQDPPARPPPLMEVVRLVAQLGGYVNRPQASPPGPQTLWLGFQRVHDFALCWNQFGPGASKPP